MKKMILVILIAIGAISFALGQTKMSNDSKLESQIIALEKAGYSFRYDLSMLTLESEERHHTEPSLPRFDKGTSPRDKSHAILERVMREKRPVSPSYLPGGIRAERQRVLAGEPFTVPMEPTKDWFDNTPLSSY